MADFKFVVQGVIEAPNETVVVEALKVVLEGVELKQDDKLIPGGVRIRKMATERIEPKAST